MTPRPVVIHSLDTAATAVLGERVSAMCVNVIANLVLVVAT